MGTLRIIDAAGDNNEARTSAQARVSSETDAFAIEPVEKFLYKGMTAEQAAFGKEVASRRPGTLGIQLVDTKGEIEITKDRYDAIMLGRKEFRAAYAAGEIQKASVEMESRTGAGSLDIAMVDLSNEIDENVLAAAMKKRQQAGRSRHV